MAKMAVSAAINKHRAAERPIHPGTLTVNKNSERS
jgi:hypothetical protein